MHYKKSVKEIYSELNTSIDGLTKEEVNKRLKINTNEITDKGKVSNLKRFLKQFNNAMIILLLIVGILALVYSFVTKTDYMDAIVILFSVLVNSIMGYVQEKKAENSLDALKTYITTKVDVIRSGKGVEILSKELVPGDIMILEAGDKVPADARIIEAINLQTDESILTGESVPLDKNSDVITKDALLHERSNMIYSGTNVVNGKVKAVVTETGDNTELGKIAQNLNKEKQEKTPLQIKVEKVSKFITYIAIFLVILVLVYGVLNHNSFITIVMLCISMIVASVPESMPIAITSTLLIGANRMAKKKAVVKQLSAIETLGATEIICSDKTGTLTKNEMTVSKIVSGSKLIINIREHVDKDSFLVKTLGLCNNAYETKKDNYAGDAVEIAFLKYLKTIGVTQTKLDKYKRITEYPFDSNRKMMSTLNKINNKNYILVKGSISSVLKNCSRVEESGKVKKLSYLIRNSIKRQENKMSKDALKVIALAYKPVSDDKKVLELTDEKNLIFLGLVGLIDPPRKEVTKAIEMCKNSNISTIMITGDSLETACSIGKQIGIIKKDKEGILGEKIRNISDKELEQVLKEYKVFARVTPEDKVRIITCLQNQGKVIAMTGDGVNDAPAIKLASVGVGMGKTGSDVTKNASDVILMDDSFMTIVTAVEEGRRIYDNVISNILYNLSSNFTEIIIILIGMFTFKNIISPIHILYIDLVADTLPSICLAFEKASKDVMKRNPTSLKTNIFTPYFTSFLSLSVVVEVFTTLLVYFLFSSMYGYAVGQTMALLSIILNEFTFAYNCRSLKELIFSKGIFSNRQLNLGIMALIVLQLLVFLTPVGAIFGLASISLLGFMFVLFVNIISFFIIELLKPIISYKTDNK